MANTADTSKSTNVIQVSYSGTGADWNYNTDGGYPNGMYVKSIIWHPSAANDVLVINEGGLDGPSIVHWKAYNDVITDGGMETWTSATDLTNWTESVSGSSTVNREGTDKHGGSYSCRFDVDASNSLVYIYQSATLAAGRKYRLTIWYKDSASGKDSKFQFRNSGGNVYIDSNGAWQASSTSVELTSATSWTEYTLNFTSHTSYTAYQLLLYRDTGTSYSCYFDDVSIIELPMTKQIDFGKKGILLKPYIDLSDCTFGTVTSTKIIFIVE